MFYTELIYVLYFIFLVPIYGQCNTLQNIHPWFPTQLKFCLTDIQHQQLCLMQSIRSRKVFQFTASVILYHHRGYIPHIGDAFSLRTEIPSFAIFHRFIPHLLRKKHIAAKRFKHMLPGADCFRTTDFYWFACLQRLDAIGNDSIQSRPSVRSPDIPRSVPCSRSIYRWLSSRPLLHCL